LKDGKASDMPFSTFVNLCGGINTGLSNDLPKVRLFKTMAEFVSLSNEEVNDIDKEKSVKILSNGQFLVFLKGNNRNKEEIKDSVEENATADTKENTTK